MTIAYCDRGGVIGFADGKLPSGMLPLHKMDDGVKLRELVAARSRHAYDGKTLLVPGVPEADSDDAALDALLAFKKWAFPA